MSPNKAQNMYFVELFFTYLITKLVCSLFFWARNLISLFIEKQRTFTPSPEPWLPKLISTSQYLLPSVRPSLPNVSARKTALQSHHLSLAAPGSSLPVIALSYISLVPLCLPASLRDLQTQSLSPPWLSFHYFGQQALIFSHLHAKLAPIWQLLSSQHFVPEYLVNRHV